MTLAEGVVGAGALSRLRAGLPHLTPALRRLAGVVLEAPKEVVYQSVTELAEAAGVGEASVIRLCRDLGFKGFQDFKLALAADLAVRPHRGESADPTNLESVLDSVTLEATGALGETRAMLRADGLEPVLSALLKTDQLLIFGAGASGVTAQDFAYKFLRLGYRVLAPADAHLAAMTAATLPKDAVVIGITRSGSTLDTVRVLDLANAAGVTTVVVTQRPRSPAANAARFALYTAHPESPLTGGSISSKMGQLLLLDALFAALLTRRPDAEAQVAATARAVTDRNY